MRKIKFTYSPVGWRNHARKKLAQEFANHWRTYLWETPFDHPDLVHNPPTPDEEDA